MRGVDVSRERIDENLRRGPERGENGRKKRGPVDTACAKEQKKWPNLKRSFPDSGEN